MKKVLETLLKAGALALVLLFPWLPGVKDSLVVNLNLAGEFAVIAISLVLLTGWVGQISLGQGAFVGIGAFATGLLAREVGIPFPVNLPLVALATAVVASLLGIVALRVRGLYLAVATLIFAWMADAYLFTSSWFVGEGGSSTVPGGVVGRPGTVTEFNLTNKKVFYLVVVATLATVVYLVSNLRDTKTGRAFFAVRGSEMAAVSLGIDVTKYKLMAFALAGALAGVAGNLMITDLRSASPPTFQFTESLFFLSIAVVGGITSIAGAIAASILFAGLNEVFFRVDFLTGTRDVVAVILLLFVLLAYPGGLGALGAPLRRLAAAMVRAMVRISPGPAATDRATDSAISGWRAANVGDFQLPMNREERELVLDARGITVKFGGLVAVNDMSLQVRQHEIVGLIGPNGAGKTTFFNSISGLNEPVSGRVRLFDKDITNLSVHVRAQMGIGRTFQLIQLFPQLSVFENLLVATHTYNPTGLFRHLALTDRAVSAERDARERVDSIVAMIGLEEVAKRRVAGLPFGILRQVEIARALVTRAPFLMLDEPASGLDNNETEELARLLRYIRADLGLSILLIEHDVQMVTSVSDYMYVIDRGTPLAEGSPDDIQRNADVIAAYLGEAPAKTEKEMESV